MLDSTNGSEVMQIHPGVAGRATGITDAGGRSSSSSMLARLMSLYIVAAVGRIGDLVPVLHEIPLAKLIALLAVISWMRNRKTSSPISWTSVPPARMTIALMGLTTLSILYSVLRSASLGVITGTVLAVMVTMPLVIKASRGWAPVKTILHGVVYASIVLAATALTSNVYGQALSTSSYDPNDFAFVLVGLLPIVVTFGIISRKAKRLVYFGIACTVVVAVLLTQSRGGLLGLIFDVVAMTYVLPFVRRGRLQFRTSASGILTRAILLAVIGIIAWQSLPETARARLGTVTDLGSDYNANVTEGGRLAIWNRNFPLILYRPWGYGAGAFEAVDGLFAGGQYRAPHSTPLQALIELGIPGFILLISTIVSSMRYLGVPQDQDRQHTTSTVLDEPRAFARALGIGLLGLCLSGLFLSQLFANVLWLLVTLCGAVGIVRRQPASTAAQAKGAPSAP